MHKIPEVRIQFSFLLQDVVSAQLDKVYNPKKSKLSTHEQALEYTKAYQLEWKKYEQNILEKLVERLGLNFYKPVIDVSLADFIIPMSNPLILHFRNDPDQFIDVLTHELIHDILTDNQYYQISSSDFDLFSAWKNLFETDDFHTLVHIPVHAILKYIYLDVLKQPQRLKRDIDFSKNLNNGQAYVDAWDYVQKNDYKVIIEKTIGVYKTIPQS